jgi:hypothetical protein
MRRTASICLGLLVVAAGAADAQDRTQALRVQDERPDERWLFSETVSPLDYAPVVTASTRSSEGSDGVALQLSIQCRRGRTDLVIASPALAERRGEQRILWSVNGAPALALPVGIAATGAGLSIKEDAARLLAALPATGELAIQVPMPQAPALDGRYAIAPLRAVLARMAAPCKWPAQRP